LPGLLVAAPSRRSLLRLDFANEAARDEFSGNLCRSARLHTLQRFEVAIVAPRGGAHHCEFGIGKFDEHGFDPSLWLGPSHSGPSPRRAPVRSDRRGEGSFARLSSTTQQLHQCSVRTGMPVLSGPRRSLVSGHRLQEENSEDRELEPDRRAVMTAGAELDDRSRPGGED
jgi:hypothetical protein